MNTGIRAIYQIDDLGTTPARVNRKTGDLYINMKKWDTLTPDEKLFVLLHEAGHVDQDTTSELLADNYAFYAYARAGKPLTKSIQSLTRLLNFTNPQHYDRVKAQINRAFSYDYHVNGNQAADPENMRRTLFSGEPVTDDEGYNNFLHLLIPKKKRQEIKKKIKDHRQAKKENKQKKELARKLEAAAKAAPKAGEAPAPTLTETTAMPAGANTPPGGKSKKGLYIAGALLVLVIVASVIYFIKKK